MLDIATDDRLRRLPPDLDRLEIDLVRAQSLVRVIRLYGNRGELQPEDIWRLADMTLERLEDVLEAVRKESRP